MQKSFGRLLYNDLITCPDLLQAHLPKEHFAQIEQFAQISHQDSLTDKALEKAFVKGKCSKNYLEVNGVFYYKG